MIRLRTIAACDSSARDGLFADKLPPRTPTLAQAVERLRAAQARESAVNDAWGGAGDTSDIEAAHARHDAECALVEALRAHGVSRVDAQAMKEGLA